MKASLYLSFRVYFFNCIMFENKKAKLSKCIDRTIFAQNQQFYFELWPRDLKINREHLFLRETTVSGMGTLKQSGLKLMNWAVNILSTDRLTNRC